MLNENQVATSVNLQIPFVKSEIPIYTCIDSIFCFFGIKRDKKLQTNFEGIQGTLDLITRHQVYVDGLDGVYNICQALDEGHPILAMLQPSAAEIVPVVITGYLETVYSSPKFYILNSEKGSQEYSWMQLDELLIRHMERPLAWAIEKNRFTA